MILGVDVGNSHTVIGLFDKSPKPIQSWRIRTVRDQTSDEFYLFAQGLLERLGYGLRDITDVVVGSVVPSVTRSVVEAFPKTKNVTHKAPFNFTIQVDNPASVGADRLINAHAAVVEHPDTALIIIDAGTATTFCAVTKKHEYLGGAIAPGLMLGAQSLFQAAAKLPAVDLQDSPSTIGKNTEAAIQSGIIRGFASQVDGMVERIREEMGNPPVKVIATGGLIPSIEKLTKTPLVVDPDLTLKGLFYLCPLLS